MIKAYLKYRKSAVTKYGVHSPFVFEIVTEIFDDKTPYYAFEEIEAIRKELKTDSRIIHVQDFGAGSRIFKSPERKVRDILKHSVKSKKYGQLLFKLANKLNAKNIIEVGTSFGITTCYLAKSNSDTQVITLEGCPQTLSIARENFDKLKLKNIETVKGNFDETLPEVLKEIKRLDLVYIDGNHTYDPTIKYFELCLEKAHNDTLIIMDDIHWSEEMERAWSKIKDHPSVHLTIDIFELGLVFLRKQQTKEHFIIKY